MLLWSVFTLRNNSENKSTEADTEKKQNQRNRPDHPQGLNVVTGSMEHSTAAIEESNNDTQSVGSLGNVSKRSKLHTFCSVNGIS